MKSFHRPTSYEALGRQGGELEGELELHIKYINVYTLYDIESQIRSTNLIKL